MGSHSIRFIGAIAPTMTGGAIDGPTYWRRIAEAAGKELTPAQIDSLIANDIAIWMRANPVMMEWVRALKRGGLKIAVLSNMPIEISRYMRQYAPWFRDFDYVCFSAEVQLAKPGRRHLSRLPESSALTDPKNVSSLTIALRMWKRRGRSACMP